MTRVSVGLYHLGSPTLNQNFQIQTYKIFYFMQTISAHVINSLLFRDL
uniref:Uncharacterized protein n=1 Tax=Rhizophora mucronata TaxID=61149 RepID=A0A2P2NIH5_RHIMU